MPSRTPGCKSRFKANADTGLAHLGGSVRQHGDIFYFADKSGDTNNDNGGAFIVNGTDITRLKANGGAALIDSVFDIDKSGTDNGTDITLSKAGGGQLPWLDVSGSPGPLAPASGGGDAGVSSALASTSSGSSSGWVAGRLASMGDLNTGSAASYFQSLASSGTAAAVATLEAADAEADNLGLDDELLDSLLADLGAE